MKKIEKGFICLVVSLVAGAVQADWFPGLRYGVLPYADNSNFQLSLQLESWQAVSYPVDADTKDHWPLAQGNKGVAVYQGQIRLAAGVYWFMEHCDDSARLVIDGKVVLNDVSWDKPTLGRFVAAEDGWYDFGLRFVDGGGGFGPSAPNGWWTRSGIAFAWKAGDEAGDSTPDANKVPDAYSVPKNAEGATLDNCLFRYDDGQGFSDELLVEQLPFAIPVTMTPAEKVSGLQEGSKVSCSSEKVYEAADGSMRADLTGYILSNRTEGVWGLREEKTDGTASVAYEHNGKPNTLVWTWDVQYKLTVGADEGGSVNVATGWVDKDAEVTLTASHPSKRFVSWNGDVPPEQALENPVTVTMDQARTINAHFGAADLYVDATNGNDDNGGFAPDDAKKTLAGAMKIASGGFTVHLAAGTYNVTAETVVDDAIRIVGDGATPDDVVIKGSQANNMRIICLNNQAARLENLTVSHGNAYADSGSRNGANVYIDAGGGTVSNCVLRESKQLYRTYGGGVFVASDKGLVTHCRITKCFMTDANGYGGVAVGMSAGRVEYCLIDGNFDCVTMVPNPNCKYGSVYMEGGTMEHCTIVDNVHGSCAIYLSGGTVSKCVIARNHLIFDAQPNQIRVSNAALKNTAFVDCVWDQGEISATCPQGVVKFADYANGDYRLASNSAGVVSGGHDWGCYETDESMTVVAVPQPTSVTVPDGQDFREAVRQVADGGEVVLAVGNHPITGNTIMIGKAVTVRGEGNDPAQVKIKKGSAALEGSLVCLSHAQALLTGVTICDHSNNNGPSQCALGVNMLQDGGTVSNCVFRNMTLTTSGHAGTALRIRRPGAHVTCCVISNITTHANTVNGGAIALEADSLIDNCLVSDCNNDTWTSPTSGHGTKDTPGAIYQTSGTIANCTIVNCKAPRVAVIKTLGGELRDCILWNNRRYNENYAESEAIGTGKGMTSEKWLNVWADIAMDGAVWKATNDVAMAFVDLANGNYRLTINSVAKDSGDRRLKSGICTVDLDGSPRRVAPRIDAGCYEEPNGLGLKLMVR